MRKLVFIIMVLFLAGCLHSPKSMLTWRWSFDGVDMPNVADFIDSVNNGYDETTVVMQRFFLDDKLILRDDNTCDLVLFKKYLHGTWLYDEKSAMLVLKDESGIVPPLRLRVDSLTPVKLALKLDTTELNKLIPAYQQGGKGMAFFRQHGRFTFFLAADKEKYSNEKDDPYSKLNNLWRIKPRSKETAGQLLERVENHLLFWKLIVQDAIDRQRSYVSFHWFESPMVLASNGAALRSYESEKDEWEQNFYDSTQAYEGYQLLKKCFHKGLTAGKADSHFENDIFMVDQMLVNLKK